MRPDARLFAKLKLRRSPPPFTPGRRCGETAGETLGYGGFAPPCRRIIAPAGCEAEPRSDAPAAALSGERTGPASFG